MSEHASSATPLAWTVTIYPLKEGTYLIENPPRLVVTLGVGEVFVMQGQRTSGEVQVILEKSLLFRHCLQIFMLYKILLV